MSVKTLFCSVLLVTAVGLNHGWAQTSSVPVPPPIRQPLPTSEAMPAEVMGEPGGWLSDWILYPRDYSAVGPVNGREMGTELFLRGGPSIPFGTPILGPALEVGWMIQGGGRLLLYNRDQTAAWIIEPSISYHNNESHRTDLKQSLSILVPIAAPFPGGPTAKRVHFGVDPGLPGVTITEFHRTFVNLGFGRLWYLAGAANDPGLNWRVGLDGGGRWGSASMEFNEIRHRTDVIGGAFAALQTDWEIPYGACWLLGGFRTEWAYTWCDILQRSTDIMDVNLLVHLGVRY